MRTLLTLTVAVACSWLGAANLAAQSLRVPWSGHGHDAQHTAVSPVPSQPLNRILWQTRVDENPQYSGNGNLLIHYGSPLITRSNTVVVPVKTGTSGGFMIRALDGATGATNWALTTDYRWPPHNWGPSYQPALTPQNRVYFAGGGGTVFYRDSPDESSGATGQLAFFGLANFNADTNAYLNNVFINTPITADRYGNIYFGFQVTGTTPVALTSGVARVDVNGNGTWVSASAMAADGAITKVVMNCAPALANDHQTLYVAVSTGNFGSGYLVALDSRTLTPLTSIRLKDARVPGNDARLPDDGTASPAVGPDGDVYFGVFANPNNHSRGWLLHFNATLTQTNTAGGFGWDNTASIVPASMVPAYTNGSPYLLMVKYNNYAGAGDGVNKIAILDPRATMADPYSGGTTVMEEVLSIAGPTPDVGITNSFPNAVREWCINTAAVDPFTKSVLVNNEDGILYRWDLTSNTLIQPVVLTEGIGEAYTPTLIGVDGTVYAINNAILFAVGR